MLLSPFHKCICQCVIQRLSCFIRNNLIIFTIVAGTCNIYRTLQIFYNTIIPDNRYILFVLTDIHLLFR